MNTIRSITAYYPYFQLGVGPLAVRCTLSIVECAGKKYLKTPFAMLDSYGDDELERQIVNGGHYYATAEDCEAYLAREYPHWKDAEPLMDAFGEARHHHGDLCGEGRFADRLGMSTLDGSLYKIIRGHRSFTLKQIKRAVKLLKTEARVY